MTYLTLALKILILFLVTVAVLRLMGKSAIVQLTPYDLVAIVIVGTVAAEPLISAQLGPTIAALGILTLLYLLFARLTLHSIGARFFLGRPTILIKHGQLVEDHLERNHLSVAQLLAILRAAGHPDLSKIDYAILEPTGFVSILPKPEITPLSAKDLGLDLPYEGLPLAVVVDGRVQRDNLRLLNRDEDWLRQKLREQGNGRMEDIIYAFAREQSEEVTVNRREAKDPDG